MKPIECNNYHECAVRLAKAALIFCGIPITVFCTSLKLFGYADDAKRLERQFGPYCFPL